MTISEDNSQGANDGEATRAGGDASTGLTGSEENEPLLHMLLRQQEERYLREISGLRREMNDRFLGSEQRSRDVSRNFPGSSSQSSFIFQSGLSDRTKNLDGSTTAVDRTSEIFSDTTVNSAQLDTGTTRAKTGAQPDTRSWMYDLGANIENNSANSHRDKEHDNRNSTFNFNSSRVKTRQLNEEGLTISFGSNGDEQQNTLSPIPSQQQNRKNFIAVDEEEFIALKDHKKQQDDRIQSQGDRIQLQDDMIQLLQTKMQQIETQGNQVTRTSMIPGRYSIFRTFTELSSPSEDSDYFSRDTFSMMIQNKIGSRSWILGTTSFSFEMVLGSMIAIDQFKASIGTSIFDVPFKVDAEVRVVQFLSIVLCLSIQSDVLTSIKSFVLLGRGSNWRQVIRVDEHNGSTVASCGLWAVRIGIPNTMKLVQGLAVTFVSFVIIVQADTIIDLLKDFTALMVISETDNILYQLAVYGYLGEQLRQEALQIEQEKEPSNPLGTDEKQHGMNNGFAYVRLVFLLLLGGMFGGWGVIFHNQINGVYFEDKFPGCKSYELAVAHFGDGVCYGGTLNTIECKFENGDCINYNTAYPNCKGEGLEGLVDVEDKLGKGECDMAFANPECDYDGGLCCPYDIHRSPTFRDGQCHSGIISSNGCDWDGGDCLDFIMTYPDCSTESGANGTALGNGICEGGGYTTEDCGYEGGDCEFGQIGGDMTTLTGIISPFDNRFNFDMKMSGDGSTVFIEIAFPGSQSGDVYSTAPGRVLGYRYDSEDKRWVEQPFLEGLQTAHMDDNDLHPSSWAVSGDGSLVAIVFPFYNDCEGQVDVFDFFGTFGSTPREVLFGNEGILQFGWLVDMTDDGTRIALSSNDEPSGNGMVQVFQLDQSEQVWAQVGDSILENTSGEELYLGDFILRINSLDGTRVFVDAFSSPILENFLSTSRHVRGYELDMKSNKWVRLGGDIPSTVDDLTSKFVVSADGSRIVQSSYSMMSTRPGEVNIFDLIADDPVSNEKKWIKLGPTIFRTYSNGKFSGSAGDGFGRGISMSADGHFLVVSSVKPSCDGMNFIEKEYIEEVGDSTSISTNLCAAGSVNMYQYKPTNPPYRPFTLLPYKRDTNTLQNIMEEAEQERDGTIVGLHVSLSGDGSKFAVSGLDLTSKNGFAKVYNVADLFYVDCIVDRLEEIGNGSCNPYDPYYTEQCGYDGGDCPLPSPVDGYDDCIVEYSDRIGDNYCHNFPPYNLVQCGYDGGDCPPPSPVDGYPNCFVSDPEAIGNGRCEYFLPYNSYDCGFDGGDCLPEEYTPTSSPSESIQPSQSPSISTPPTESAHPTLSSSPSDHPSTSATPTTANIVIYLELHTDTYPRETTWSLTNESDDGMVIASGHSLACSDQVHCEKRTLHSFSWILNRCDSYLFEIFDWGYDGFESTGYATLIVDGGRGNETLGKIEGNFGTEGSIDIYICEDEDLLTSQEEK